MTINNQYIGQKFNHLTIVDYKSGQPHQYNYQCKCDCGNIVWVRYGNLKAGNNKSCGCANKTISNISGNKYGCLTILEPSENTHGEWKIKCDCGKIFDYKISPILAGLKKTCSSKTCLYSMSLKLSSKKFNTNIINDLKLLLMNKIPENYINTISFDKKFLSIKRGAKARNLDITISKEYIENIYNKQNGLCAISKVPLNNSTASLDRIDSKKGYIYDNVQWVHTIINILKLNFDQSYFIDMCKIVSDFNKNKLPLNFNTFEKYSPINKTTYKGELKRSVWNTIIKKAHRRGIFFDPLLTPEDAEEIFMKQNGRCAISGIQIPLRPFKSYKQLIASLDRINSSLGYIKNNIQWVHKHINLMKSKLNEELFLLLCDVIKKNSI